MKKLLEKIKSAMKKLFTSLKYESKQYLPVAINAVEILKKVMDSPVDDIVIAAVEMLVPSLPASKINELKSKLVIALPKILLELNLINTIVNIESINDQLQAILDQLKLSSDEVKAEKYHILASKILVILSDGKIT